MTTKPLTGVLATLLVITLIAPAAFFVAPQRASASAASCIGGVLGGALGSLGSLAGAAGIKVPGLSGVPVSNISIEGSSGSTAGSTAGSCINDVIVIPLARAAIRAMLQKMTASVISWINNTPGQNGTSAPSYVQDLQGHMQSVGTVKALAFLSQFRNLSNSPFATAITSSLNSTYLQQSSLGGFFGANQCTLTDSSPNINAYLAGNWSQGGTAAWFALTTQTQNNPYTLYQASQAQLNSQIANAQAAQATQLSWGQGFLSWCGADTTTYPAGNNPDEASSNVVSATPTAQCVNKDGTPTPIQTPGSIIHDYAQKAVVSSGFDQLISANDLDNALSSIVSALATQVLGGAGGLFGSSVASSNSAANNGTITSQLQNYSASSVSATQSSFQTAQTMLDRIAAYTSAWSTIGASADTASTSAVSLANFCTSAADTAALAQWNSSGSTWGTPSTPTPADLASMHSPFIDAARAQAAAVPAVLSTEIAPIIAQAQAAPDAASTTQALALQVQTEASGGSSTTGTAGATLASDVAILVTMFPTLTDLSDAQTNATAGAGAIASPVGSLTISSAGSLVSQMNLIISNVATLKTTVCNPSSSLYATSGGGA